MAVTYSKYTTWQHNPRTYLGTFVTSWKESVRFVT